MNAYVEQEFAAGAQRRRIWGGVLFFAASVIWAVLAWQLTVPFSDGDDGSSSSRECQSVLFYEGDAPTWHDSTREECRAQRRWPEMLGWLGLSVPLSVVGAVLYSSGSTSLRMREYMAEHRIAAASAASAVATAKDASRKK
ncbi:hypothetical protein AB0I94_09620 [Streptomyces sp. NPDC050147]|uniref:hypothetical protein n=1 Tax=Streptomyces sp. NPDC050147 TaxID=3155513 RepID=UPI003416CBF6